MVTGLNLAYLAREFHGGPDLLAPSFVGEVDHKREKWTEPADIQGPRHSAWFPACR